MRETIHPLNAAGAIIYRPRSQQVFVSTGIQPGIQRVYKRYTKSSFGIQTVYKKSEVKYGNNTTNEKALPEDDRAFPYKGALNEKNVC